MRGKICRRLSELMLIGEELGELLTQRAVAALGIAAATAESYGKAAAVGENGEIEHAAAILHPKLGAPVRKVLGQRRGADSVFEEARRTGRGAGHSSRPQRRGVRAQSLRWHGSAHQRRAPSE